MDLAPARHRLRLAPGALRLSRAVRFAPLALLLLIIAALVWRLATPVDTTVHSKLEGRPVPHFPPVAAARSSLPFGSAELATGQPHLVNFFASWCVPCVSEVKVLEGLKDRGIVIDGIAVRDRAEDIDGFLQRNGNPYRAITSDPHSDLQIQFGSSGVPESFIVDGKGIIRYQHIGPIEAADAPMILTKMEQAR